MAFEPRTPPPPEAPRFDAERGAWVLSRYADVVAALRAPQLWAVDGKRRIQPKDRDEVGRVKERGDMLEALSASHIASWQPQVERMAHSILDALPSGRDVDLFSEFTLPWGLSVAMLVTGADEQDRRLLSDLGRLVFAGTGEPDDSPVRPEAATATAELVRIFEKGPVPMGEPTFIALSQTTPRLLANAWLALVQHPAEYARLRAQPDLMPGAVEELLRFAGIVRRIYRRATADVDIGDVRIAEGELVMLMLASANRDPEQFPDPNRLDVTRPIVGHVSLGTGRNSCVGAMLIRMAASIATGALVAQFAAVQFKNLGEWRQGSGFGFPTSVNVRLRRA